MNETSKFESHSRFLTCFMASLLVALAVGCGGGVGDPTKITVAPATASVAIGGTQRFVATGTDSDNISSDISNTVTWTSGDVAVATVVSPGVATGVSAGTATITATSGAISGSATLTVTTPALGPPPVPLGAAGTFVILTTTGISDTLHLSTITGDIGTSPASGATIDVTCAEIITGTIFSVDAAVQDTCRLTVPALLTPAVASMQTAYTDAAGRAAGVGTFLNVGAGIVANQNLGAGTYTWGSNVTIPTNLTLSGGANDVWIFQIPGTLNASPNIQVLLTNGAVARNIFWQVAGTVTLGTGSQFQGNILALTNIAMLAGASINGRLLAQTGVTLQQNAVTEP